MWRINTLQKISSMQQNTFVLLMDAQKIIGSEKEQM